MSVRRRPWPAALLSLVVPGTGQLYAGALLRGLAWFGVHAVVAWSFLLAVWLPPGTTGFAALAVSVVLAPLLVVPAAIDAFVVTRNRPGTEALRACQRPSGFLLLLAAGLLLSYGGGSYAQHRLLHAFLVPTSSMLPTIRPGDVVLANLRRPQVRPLRRGDLVAFVAPDSGEAYVQRVIALAGETVEARRSEILVDGAPIPCAEGADGTWRETVGDRSYAVRPGGARRRATEVPDGHVFLCGDNRSNAKDSRVIGPVPLANVLGVVEYRTWSADDVSSLGPLE